MKKTRRTAQVGHNLRDALVEVIRHDLKDVDLGLVSITDVEVSPDLRFARVFISGLDEKQGREAVERLQNLRGRARHFLGQRIHLRVTPELEFRYDDTTARASRIEELLRGSSRTMTTPDVASREVAERIRAGRNFLITSHRNPDGDALGSGIALQGLIRKLGKDAKIVVRDGFSKPLHNIPGAKEVLVSDSLPADYPKAYDAIFTMECPEVERTGYDILPGPAVNIDHHLGNTMYGEINYLDLEAPSVGEMVMQLNRAHLHLTLDPDVATAMYVSLATDTGFFRYHNTTLRAFEAAAELVRAGAVPGDVSLWINESVTAGSVRLLGLCLNTLELHADGKLATLELPNPFFDQAGATPEDTEGIVNYGRTIDGVLVSALLKEGDKGTRVSLRAKPGVDVQAVAAMFGGGGHKAASGCTIPLPLAAAKEKLIGILKEIV